MMDSIIQYINQYDNVEFLVSLDYHVNEEELYTCDEWGGLYTELGFYNNEPMILNGDADLNGDGNPDYNIWNLFAGITYSAYAFIDHHMVIKYLFHIPDYNDFTQIIIPELLESMYGCLDPEASNFDPNAVYDNESCSFLSTTNSKNYFSDNFELLDSSPNPFNPITSIHYRMNLPDNIRIGIYDINGNLIIDIFNGYKISGNHTIEWDAENRPSGVYFVKLNAGEFTQTQKLMLVK